MTTIAIMQIFWRGGSQLDPMSISESIMDRSSCSFLLLLHAGVDPPARRTVAAAGPFCAGAFEQKLAAACERVCVRHPQTPCLPRSRR